MLLAAAVTAATAAGVWATSAGRRGGARVVNGVWRRTFARGRRQYDRDDS